MKSPKKTITQTIMETNPDEREKTIVDAVVARAKQYFHLSIENASIPQWLVILMEITEDVVEKLKLGTPVDKKAIVFSAINTIIDGQAADDSAKAETKEIVTRYAGSIIDIVASATKGDFEINKKRVKRKFMNCIGC